MATVEQVEDVLRAVHDPEIPALSIVDLGMVGQVSVDDMGVAVSLTPTFVGCSAQRIIQQEVQERLARQYPGLRVDVRFDLSEAWTSDRITAAGREALRASGIAPPGESLEDVACPFCDSHANVLENLFASTSCRSLYYCRECRNPFEAFKPISPGK